MLVDGITQLIGNTPLLHAKEYEKNVNAEANIFVKLEYLNPAGSVKDRAALYMVEDAERRGILKPDATIIEPTSGNTGVGLALVASVKGYKLIPVLNGRRTSAFSVHLRHITLYVLPSSSHSL